MEKTLNLIINLVKKGKLKEALKYLDQLLQIYPENTKLLDLNGVIFLEMSRFSEALHVYKKITRMEPLNTDYKNNLAVSYFGLAEEKRKDFDFAKAISYYTEAVLADKLMISAHKNLGLLLKHTGDTKGAISSLQKALDLDPSNESTQHCLNALLGNKTSKAPKKHVSDAFDQYAEKFDNHLIKDLDYKIPDILRRLIDKVDDRHLLQNAVDLGCGTGISGSAFSDKVKYFEGIDVSKKMLQIAERKNIYDKLAMEDIETYLQSSIIDYDLFIATDVFIYMGDLDETFRLVSEKSRKNAIFGFSTEHIGSNGFTLLPSARYGHSRKYIKSLVFKYNFDEIHFSIEPLRKEREKWIEGGVYVLTRRSS